MTTAAICATREVSWRPSFYRGEQYDADLALYYLRARYYNPLTGRFMSRDPEDPKLRDSNAMPIDPKKLHKYLYAGGDPVNAKDPTGRDDEEEYGFLYTEIRTGLSAYEYGFALGVAAKYFCYGDAIYALVHWEFTGESASPLEIVCLAITVGNGP